MTQFNSIPHFNLESFTRERWLAEKLDMPMHWDAGVSTPESRRELIRAFVLTNELADTVIARTRSAGALTARMCFQRTYGSPLQTDELDFAFTSGDER